MLNRKKPEYVESEEGECKNHQQMKERLKKKYNRKLRMILKYELNYKNKIAAFGALALPALRHRLV
jgi:hypothetical protein